MSLSEKIIPFHYAPEASIFITNKAYEYAHNILNIMPSGEIAKFKLHKFVRYNVLAEDAPFDCVGYSCVRLDWKNNNNYVESSIGKPEYAVPGFSHRFDRQPPKNSPMDMYWKYFFMTDDTVSTPESIRNLYLKFECATITKHSDTGGWGYLGITQKRYFTILKKLNLARFLWEIKAE